MMMVVHTPLPANNSAQYEKPLRTYCDDSEVDIIVMGFMHMFPSDPRIPGCPNLNFANHCEQTQPNGMLYCPDIGADVTYCQGKGKKVLLSLGGAAGVYGFANDTQVRVVWCCL